MSEATVNTIARSNAEIYDRLLVSIEAGIGLLQIFIAVCDADRVMAAFAHCQRTRQAIARFLELA